MAADMALGFDHDHRRAGLARHDGGRQAGRARADDDNVGLAVPIHCICHCGLFRLDCGRDTNSIADFVSLGMIASRSRTARHGGFRAHPPAHPRSQHENDLCRRCQGERTRLQGFARRRRSELPAHRLPDDGRRAAFFDHHHATQGHHRGLAAAADRLCARGERAEHDGAHGRFHQCAGRIPDRVRRRSHRRGGRRWGEDRAGCGGGESGAGGATLP